MTDITTMAQRLAKSRQRLQAERAAQDHTDTAILTTAAVIGALNDMAPPERTAEESSVVGLGGDFGGGGASGEF